MLAVHLSVLAAVLPGALLASACGGRTGLEVTARSDAAVPRDAGWDAGRDAGVRPDAGSDAGVDAGHDPLGCDGLPLPGVGGLRSVAVPAQMGAVAVHLPDPRGLLVFGGVGARREPATAAFLDLATGTSRTVRLVGSDLLLPTSGATATYTPDGDYVIVVGGRVDGMASDRVLRLLREGPPRGDWRLRVEVLAPFPAGTVTDHVAIYDPIGRRVVVHGGYSSDPIPIRRRQTWALDERGDWALLADREMSPLRDTVAMGYDPVLHRAIVIGSSEDVFPHVGVEILDLTPGEEHWTSGGGALDFAPSTRGELTWDPRICGFHLFAARRTRCVLEHWVWSLDDLDRPPRFRGELDLGDDAHFLAAAAFDPSSRELALVASARCVDPAMASEIAHIVRIE